jgi:hypothetical protein
MGVAGLYPRYAIAGLAFNEIKQLALQLVLARFSR